jgi:plasmid segregation protein ParM
MFSSGKEDELKSQVNLMIDPGYYTLDWVLANGIRINPERSGASSGGMSACLNEIRKGIAADFDINLSSVSEIDQALRTGRKVIKLDGRPVDLEKVIPYGKAKAREYVNELASSVGNLTTVENIVVVGGGASFFMDALQEKLQREITVVPGSEFANVRGFLRFGERSASRLLRNKAA